MTRSKKRPTDQAKPKAKSRSSGTPKLMPIINRTAEDAGMGFIIGIGGDDARRENEGVEELTPRPRGNKPI